MTPFERYCAKAFSHVENESLRWVMIEQAKHAWDASGADELLEALEYCRMVIDQMSEKAHGKADRVYCMQILKDGNSIDKAIRKARREDV